MDNGMEGLLDTYLFETNTLLEQLDELLINAEQNSDFTEDDVNEIFRSMHTIKGSSAMLEFNSLMEISHHIEDLFFYIRENGMDKLNDKQKEDLFNLMFDSTDKLREEISKVEMNEPLDDNIDPFIEKINYFLSGISGENTDDSDSNEISNTQTNSTKSENPDDVFTNINNPFAVKLFFDEGVGMENLRAYMLITSLEEADIKCDFYPKDIETNVETCDYLIDNGFLIGFNSENDISKLEPIISTTGSVRSYEILHNPKNDDVEEENKKEDSKSNNKETSSASKEKQKNKKREKSNNKKPVGKPVKQSLISVNLSKLDTLMAIVGEIVITESMVTSSPDLKGLKLDSFIKSARQLRKLTDDLQDVSMSLRMVSVSNVFQKMNRVVRDMSKSLDKKTKLTIIGQNTEVDKTIVDNIGDPIMHLVRNAMDHGIESAQERKDAGKPEEAEIILSAEHTGSEVIISIEDDGKGMDPEAILNKAENNGILTKPREEYSKKEALMLLMMPGFSTNENVTEYSGRGVGMDVVKKNVENIGGVVSISSEMGVGSKVTLKIPLTLAIADGMEFSVGDCIFTIPILNIRQSFKAQESDIILDAAGNRLIKCLDGFYPIVKIADLYNMQGKSESIEDGILIWVEAAEKSYCLFVDEILGEQQVVVKPLPGYLNTFNIKDAGISGCTILGNGEISLILDVSGVYNASQAIIMR